MARADLAVASSTHNLQRNANGEGGGGGEEGGEGRERGREEGRREEGGGREERGRREGDKDERKSAGRCVPPGGDSEGERTKERMQYKNIALCPAMCN